MSKEEQHIISDVLKGKVSAERELYLRYRRKWYITSMRYARNSYDAEDILQEGLIQIFKDLHQFDVSKSKFGTWSNRVLVHAALKYLKKNTWQNNFEELDKVGDVQAGTDIFDNLSAKELTLLLQSLPTGYRVVFNMYAIEGYTHKEIAKELNIAEGTSKSQLSKARKALQNLLESQLAYES